VLIIKTTKQRFKKNFYTVLLEDGRKISCSDEIMVKYGISTGAILEDAAMAAFIMEAQRSAAMDTALRLLSLQQRSRVELSDKLKSKKFDPAVIDVVLNRIAEMGYLNDESFARNRVAELAAQGKGPAFIKFELKRKGIAADTVTDILKSLRQQPGSDPLNGGRQAAKKYWARLKAEQPRKAAAKLTGFLARRGFDIDDVRLILRELRADESSIDDTGEMDDQ
jgi:regulatory protein